MKEYRQTIRQAIKEWREIERAGYAYQDAVLQYVQADIPMEDVNRAFAAFDTAFFRERPQAADQLPALGKLSLETYQLCHALQR